MSFVSWLIISNVGAEVNSCSSSASNFLVKISFPNFNIVSSGIVAETLLSVKFFKVKFLPLIELTNVPLVTPDPITAILADIKGLAKCNTGEESVLVPSIDPFTK